MTSSSSNDFVCVECKQQVPLSITSKLKASHFSDGLDESFILVSAILQPPQSFQQQHHDRLQEVQKWVDTVLLNDTIPVEQAVAQVLQNKTLCTECITLFMELLDEQIAQLQLENETYKKKQVHKVSDQVIPAADEMHLRELLKESEGHMYLYMHENKKWIHQLETLQHLEENYWKDVYDAQDDVSKKMSKKEIIQREMEHTTKDYQRLLNGSKVPIMQLFFIQYSDMYAIVDGVRIGKAADIDWSETNAGLGIIALMARIVELRFQPLYHSAIKFYPQGSTSYIEFEDTHKYELYFTDRLKVSAQLNKALAYLLQFISACILVAKKNIAVHISGTNISMESTKQARSILYNASDEPNWNHALRHVVFALSELSKLAVSKK